MTETIAAVLLVIAAVLLTGVDSPEPYYPPEPYQTCHFTRGGLYLEMDSQFRRNTTHFTRISFVGKTPAEVEAEVIKAYYWWAEHVSPEATYWFVREARKQDVFITLSYGHGRYPIPEKVRVAYPCV